MVACVEIREQRSTILSSDISMATPSVCHHRISISSITSVNLVFETILYVKKLCGLKKKPPTFLLHFILIIYLWMFLEVSLMLTAIESPRLVWHDGAVLLHCRLVPCGMSLPKPGAIAQRALRPQRQCTTPQCKIRYNTALQWSLNPFC